MKEGKPEQPPYYENLRAELEKETGNISIWLDILYNAAFFFFFLHAPFSAGSTQARYQPYCDSPKGGRTNGNGALEWVGW